MFQPVFSRKSRTNCLSKDGGEPPGRQVSGPARSARSPGVSDLVDPDDGAGVVEPELELRVGEDDSAARRVRGGAPVELEREGPQARGEVGSGGRRHRLERDVDVVSGLGLRRGREDRLGEPVRLAEALRERDAADGSRTRRYSFQPEPAR